MMKNILRLSALALFFVFSTSTLFGQLFVSKSNEWWVDDCGISFVTGETSCSTHRFWFGDTVLIDTVSYLRLNSTNQNWFMGGGGYYREENGIVYRRNSINEGEIKIYNFNLNIGEEFEIGDANYSFEITVLDIDSVALNSGEKRKRLKIARTSSLEYEAYWIEGIGSTLSPMNTLYMYITDAWINLNCFHVNNAVEYQIGSCTSGILEHFEQSASPIVSTPNPATDQVRFAYSDAQPMAGVSATVTDAAGHVVWQSPTNTDRVDHIIWQTGNTPAGIYFYTIREANGKARTGRLTLLK